MELEPGVTIERVRRLMTFDQVKMLMKHYEDSLGSYTYLTADE